MGKGFFPFFCFSSSSNSPVKLVFWGGGTKFLTEKQHAGELLFQFPDHVVCRADSFFIGQQVPVLSIDDELHAGETYFVIPVDRFPCNQNLTAVTLASLSPAPTKPSLASLGQCPFQYVKDANGRTLIKVQPEFIAKVITAATEGGQKCGSDGGALCSTPELKKHYAQLVGSRPWSPKLETISESRSRLSSAMRLSPVRLFGLEKNSR